MLLIPVNRMSKRNAKVCGGVHFTLTDDFRDEGQVIEPIDLKIRQSADLIEQNVYQKPPEHRSQDSLARMLKFSIFLRIEFFKRICNPFQNPMYFSQSQNFIFFKHNRSY